MHDKKKILAISGSTRKDSINLKFIKAIADLRSKDFEISIFEDLSALPHFNPDDDGEKLPTTILNFRKKLLQADGILICSPEYAFGVPGSLKNAIDWTVSSGEFYKKPVAFITASTSGEKAHASFLETLKAIGSKMTEDTQLLISNAKTKINADNKIIDPETLEKIRELIEAFKLIF